MEEILASIRRIIADDQEVLSGAARERDEPSSLRNVLDLTERQTAQLLGRPFEESGSDSEVEQGVHSGDHSINDLQLDSYFDEQPDDAVDTATSSRAGEAAFSDSRPAETLLSSAANASVSDAFTRLGSTIMPTQPQTLEDLMKDLLRPILKSWLDENLPSLVERLVQAEIERISRGQR